MVDTLELVVSVISIIAAIIASSVTLGYRIGERFVKIEMRLDSMGSRLGNLESRVTFLESEVKSLGSSMVSLESRVGSLETEVKSLGSRVASLESEVKNLGSRISSLESEVRNIGSRIDSLETEVKSLGSRVASLESEVENVGSLVERIAKGFSGYQEFFVEFLVGENVIPKEKGDLARNEAKRIMELALVNPLTKEEWRKIKYYLEKDELTLEEALEFRDLARKVLDEYGDRYEAWKLHLYASMMVGFARKRLAEKEKKAEEKQDKQG